MWTIRFRRGKKARLIFFLVLALILLVLTRQGTDYLVSDETAAYMNNRIWLPQWIVRQMNKLCYSGCAGSWLLTRTVCAVLSNICSYPPVVFCGYHTDHEELFSWDTRILTWWNQFISIIILLLIAALLTNSICISLALAFLSVKNKLMWVYLMFFLLLFFQDCTGNSFISLSLHVFGLSVYVGNLTASKSNQ